MPALLLLVVVLIFGTLLRKSKSAKVFSIISIVFLVSFLYLVWTAIVGVRPLGSSDLGWGIFMYFVVWPVFIGVGLFILAVDLAFNWDKGSRFWLFVRSVPFALPILLLIWLLFLKLFLENAVAGFSLWFR